MKTEMLLYRNGSQSGQLIAGELNLNYSDIGRDGRYNCINWGSGTSRLVRRLPRMWLNTREAVDIAQNKLHTIQRLSACNVSVPTYFTDIDDAITAVNEGAIVYCRTLLRANQGRGIVVAHNADQIVNAGLYTLQAQHDKEYRMHVFHNNVIAGSKKIEMEDFDGVIDTYIRNHGKGWKFSLCDVNRVHNKIKMEAIKAVKALGLDFGAVDLCWNSSTETVTILEVNTAPAIEGTVLEAYINRFKAWIANPSRVSEYVVKYTKMFTKSIIAGSTEEACNIISDTEGRVNIMDVSTNNGVQL